MADQPLMRLLRGIAAWDIVMTVLQDHIAAADVLQSGSVCTARCCFESRPFVVCYTWLMLLATESAFCWPVWGPAAAQPAVCARRSAKHSSSHC
jgi:hypothetical protein